MSIDRVLRCLTVLVIILHAVVLSVWIGVGGCWWPSLIRICLIISAFFALTKTPAILASADDNIMCRKIEHLLKIGPFNGGSTVGGFEGSDCSVLRKK